MASVACLSWLCSVIQPFDRTLGPILVHITGTYSQISHLSGLLEYPSHKSLKWGRLLSTGESIFKWMVYPKSVANH